MTTNTAADKRKLYLRWIAANALSESFGLGLTFALIGLVSSRLEQQEGVWPILVSFVAAVASGAIEATLVGLAQWWAMRPWFPTIIRLEWWRATLVGALVAYVLGYLPTTLMSLSESATQTPVEEPPQSLLFLFYIGLGLVGGAVLAFAQWLVLRRHVERAGRWLLANMLAWTVGMPIIFWGIDIAFQQSSTLRAILLMAGILLLVGTIVGAIHGAFLVQLASRKEIH